MSSPAGVWRVEVVERLEALTAHVDAWDELARHVVEPNVCYESWMLRPAIDALGDGVNLFFVLVYRDDPHTKQPSRLFGFFPCERRRRAGGLVSVVRLWEHLYSFLHTPLIHRDAAAETLGVFLDWLYSDPRGAAILELPLVNADGLFAQALLDAIQERGLLTHVVEAYNRAMLVRAADAASYLAATSGAIRREVRRQRKRLGEQGQLESRQLTRADEVDDWIERFLRLEASGWKGREQTALASMPSHAAFFTTACRAAFARGQLMMLGLFLDGEAVAMNCNFTSGTGSFGFKIAFDERFARFAPGVQLQIDNIEAFHTRSDLHWMDSCAVAQHDTLNRLWHERRTVQHLLISTGRRRGTFLLGLLPLARSLKRLFRRRNVESSTAVQGIGVADRSRSPARSVEPSAVPRPAQEMATVQQEQN